MVHSHFESGAAGGWAALDSWTAAEVTAATATSDRTTVENLIDAPIADGRPGVSGSGLLVAAVGDCDVHVLLLHVESDVRGINRTVGERAERDLEPDGVLLLVRERGDRQPRERVRGGVQIDGERVAGLEVVLDDHLHLALRVGGIHRDLPGVLRRLDAGGVGRDVRLHQRDRLLHRVADFLFLVRDDLAAYAPLVFRGRRGRALDRDLHDLAVGAVVAAVLLLRLLLALHRDDRGLNPLVRAQSGHARRERLLEGGHSIRTCGGRRRRGGRRLSGRRRLRGR